VTEAGGVAMNDCTIMELHCLERAKLDPSTEENGLHRRSGGTN